jgi:translation initiation factor IF-2
LATRVFELAKELGVTSKDILGKCSAEGLELKNHMAVLSAGLEASIREWFADAPNGNAVETTAHVDLGAARAKATRQRRRKGEPLPPEPGPESGAAQAVAEAPPEAVEVLATTAPSHVPIAVPEAEPVVEAPPQAAAEAAAPTPVMVEEAEAPVPVAEAPAPAPVAPQAPAMAQGPTMGQGPTMAHGPSLAAATIAPPAEVAPPAPSAAPVEPPAALPPSAPPPAAARKTPVVPAGPQLVPRPAQMKGPRVVRMEKPDVLVSGRPRPAYRPPGSTGPSAGATAGAGTASSAPKRGRTPVPGEEEEAPGKKGAKRRGTSPRRRGGGRSADSGEKLKEWRDKDLAERSLRLAAAAGGTLRRHRATIARKAAEAGTAPESKKIQVEEPITVKSFSAATGIKSSEIIKKMMETGVLLTLNQVLSREAAESIVLDYGLELDIRAAKNPEEEMLESLSRRLKGQTKPRAPIVTFMGHVDHGKTSLLDRIRNATVAAGEAGGITQHVGAYRYDVGDQHVVFLDTPGHEAFTAMRSRGANMTDVVVLVVAADDGFMPQTTEALSHAKAAGVPIVVALNKVDLPNANIQRVMGQLAEHGLNPHQWGGDVEVIETSAATGKGIDTLLETLSLMAEILELKAEEEAPASGFVVEAEMSPQRGAIGRLLVLNGTLKIGDIVVAGTGFGRVRQMVDHLGKSIGSAGPSSPVEVSGLDEMPQAGDRFYVVATLEEAQQVSDARRQNARQSALAFTQPKTLQGILDQIQAGKTTELPIILKADVQGSAEALAASIGKLGTTEIRVKILHTGVGGITAGDVTLAEASSAIIIGFNVVADAAARHLAEDSGVDIRTYRIIYEVIDDIRAALERGLAPEIRMETLGRADVRQVFKVSRVGTVAGCMVTDGVVNRNARVRIIRNNVVLEDDRTLESLKRFKDDAREVRAGMECGLKIAGYDDLKEGDSLEFYQRIEVARKL